MNSEKKKVEYYQNLLDAIDEFDILITNNPQINDPYVMSMWNSFDAYHETYRKDLENELTMMCLDDLDKEYRIKINNHINKVRRKIKLKAFW